jgi:serine/threonine protein kinase
VPIEGEIIADRYRLDALIGKGGMSSVWAGVHLALDRPVAVKFLLVRGDDDSEALTAQFLREARIAAAVRHRNVVDVLDFGTTEQGTPFMVMEMLDGETLGARLVRSPPLAVNELMHIVNLTLRGLTAAHDAGIVHRDLKPENIFLQYDDAGVYPKIFDFGISRSLDMSGPRSALTTKEGFLVGTPHYMSPEQVRGLRDIDQRTDIYSMGVILYEALTGRLPFDAENIGDLVINIVQATPPPISQLRPEVGRSISKVVSRAMHRDRDERFMNAREMQDCLLKAVEEKFGRPGHTISVMPRPNRWSAPELSQERVEEKIKGFRIKNDLLRAISGGGQTDRRRVTVPIPDRGVTPRGARSKKVPESTTPLSWSIADRQSRVQPGWIRPSPRQALLAVIPPILLFAIVIYTPLIVDSKIDKPTGKNRAVQSNRVTPLDKERDEPAKAFASQKRDSQRLPDFDSASVTQESERAASAIPEQPSTHTAVEEFQKAIQPDSVANSTVGIVQGQTGEPSQSLALTDSQRNVETKKREKKARVTAKKRKKRRRRPAANQAFRASEPKATKSEPELPAVVEPPKRNVFRVLDY